MLKRLKSTLCTLLVLCLSLFLFSCTHTRGRGFDPISEEAEKGEEKSFEYQDLVEHEALEVSFTVHLLGPWDGSSGGTAWSPDRFFCKVGGMTLVDSTFNNCHLAFTGNTWQSFPDPYHEGQIDLSKDEGCLSDGTHLYLGSRGASSVASQGFKWGRVPAMDSSYTFRFVIPHNKESVQVHFGTIWNEELESVATYRLENVQLKLLKKIPALDAKAEAKAWSTFFSGFPEASQQGWENIYTTHPNKLTERVEALLRGDKERKEYLVEQLKEGNVPSKALFLEVDSNPFAKDLNEQLHRILCLRELALGRKFMSREERVEIWDAPRSFSENRVLSRVCSRQSYGPKGCVPLQKAQMRLASYLRMINTEKSLKLAEELDPSGRK